MAYIKIELDQMQSVADKYMQLQTQLTQVNEEFQNYTGQLDWEITAKEQIDFRISDLYGRIDSCAIAAEKIGTYLNFVKEEYEKLEQEVVQWKSIEQENSYTGENNGNNKDSFNFNPEIAREILKFLVTPDVLSFGTGFIPHPEIILEELDFSLSAISFLKRANTRIQQIYPYMEVIPAAIADSIKKVTKLAEWADVLQVVVDTASTGYRKYQEYSADGDYNLDDIASTMMEASISGLVSIVKSFLTSGSDLLNIGASEIIEETIDSMDIPGKITTTLKDWVGGATRSIVTYFMEQNIQIF